jgi:hypothetical protein
MAKWKAAMDLYRTTSGVVAAVGQAVTDGIIIGNSVMDEPNVHGLGDGNTWGPSGTMTKLRVDSMCTYVKNIFPTLPVGVAHGHDAFEPTKSYTVCDFIVDQYSARFGDSLAYRQGALTTRSRSRTTFSTGESRTKTEHGIAPVRDRAVWARTSPTAP